MTEIIIPDYLKTAIFNVMHMHPEWGTKEGATGQCVFASDTLLFECDELQGDIVDGCVMGDNRPHHWAIVEGINIDLTARQFDEKEPFPKVWINGVDKAYNKFYLNISPGTSRQHSLRILHK